MKLTIKVNEEGSLDMMNRVYQADAEGVERVLESYIKDGFTENAIYFVDSIFLMEGTRVMSSIFQVEAQAYIHRYTWNGEKWSLSIGKMASGGHPVDRRKDLSKDKWKEIKKLIDKLSTQDVFFINGHDLIDKIKYENINKIFRTK